MWMDKFKNASSEEALTMGMPQYVPNPDLYNLAFNSLYEIPKLQKGGYDAILDAEIKRQLNLNDDSNSSTSVESNDATFNTPDYNTFTQNNLVDKLSGHRSNSNYEDKDGNGPVKDFE